MESMDVLIFNPDTKQMNLRIFIITIIKKKSNKTKEFDRIGAI